jgi:predicted amidophosphoribosyltransferase
MKTLAYLLCAALAVLPFNLSAQTKDPPPDPEPISLVQLVVGGVIVVVGTVAVYTVYKTAKASQDNCPACRQLIPAKSYSCPGCGKAYRCEECGTKLPANGTQCTKCSTPIPPPKKILKSVQSSANGVNWTTVASLNTQTHVFYDDLSVMYFATQPEFDSWVKSQLDIVSVKEIGIAPYSWFRLASE